MHNRLKVNVMRSLKAHAPLIALLLVLAVVFIGLGCLSQWHASQAQSCPSDSGAFELTAPAAKEPRLEGPVLTINRTSGTYRLSGTLKDLPRGMSKLYVFQVSRCGSVSTFDETARTVQNGPIAIVQDTLNVIGGSRMILLLTDEATAKRIDAYSSAGASEGFKTYNSLGEIVGARVILGTPWELRLPEIPNATVGVG